MNPQEFVKRYLILFSILLPLILVGQDVSFTQFYANKINVNPAFTGTTEEGRVGMVHRSQWAAIPGAYTSQFVAAEYSLLEKHGVGISFVKDQSGGSLLSMTAFNGVYSYEVTLNESLTLRSGMALGLGQKRLAVEQLVFEDNQPMNITVNGASSFFDVSVGGLLYSDKLWISTSGSHFTKPNVSFIEGNEFVLSPLYSISAGGKVKVYTAYSSKKESVYVYPLLEFKSQGLFKMINIGAFTNISNLIFGSQYRMTDNVEAISGILGLKIEGLQFTYSYDHTLSKLQSYTGGSHEVSMIYEFGVLNKWSSDKKKYPWL